MSEKEIVHKTEVPATVESLQADLRALGVKPGMVVLVHSSLSAMGWVCGGSVAVIAALQKTLGSTGTLVMPTHSPDLTEPSGWENPPVPESWWSVIRENMPAYDPELTPTRSMGIIAEDIPQATRRPPQRTSAGLVLCMWPRGVAHHR